jgi:hypothetical protein
MATSNWMLELADPIDCVVREHGEGSIRVMVWGSVNSNPQFLVRLYGSGKLLVVDQSDLRTQGNPGDERDIFPLPIPEGWEPRKKPSDEPKCPHNGCQFTGANLLCSRSDCPGAEAL